MKQAIKIVVAVLIAGKLFWLGFRALELSTWSVGLPMIIGALWICLTTVEKKK